MSAPFRFSTRHIQSIRISVYIKSPYDGVLIMKHETEYQSYILRLWLADRAGGDGVPPAWQGEIVHIQSGIKTSFQDLDGLNAFLLRNLTHAPDVKSKAFS